MSGPGRGRRLLDGRYELNTIPLARGGMGEVYEGRDIRLEREVAVKFIRFPGGRSLILWCQRSAANPTPTSFRISCCWA